METSKHKKTFGLALSGSGNRTSFYVGFLEELEKAELRPDYISASSGGSFVAAAYGAGRLNEMKRFMSDMDETKAMSLLTRAGIKSGGIYSLEKAYEELSGITQGANFEDAQIKMSFSAVDIESGELVNLCMGDLAKAALISCTLPGLFVPMKWGSRTLVDGGLLVMMPTDVLKKAGIDVVVGVNMRGTEHIFTEKQLTVKKIYNFFKKITFLDSFDNIIDNLGQEQGEDGIRTPNFFTVLGKSLDLAIQANSGDVNKNQCDLEIVPNIPKLKRGRLDKQANLRFYEMGRQSALENIPQIRNLIN
ncbi:MAG: patatin-like phospholipase family protein [Candidatus Doudnabacteria bacterium]|nr:patatin-like phospholipase family protein [Candidatus Doudnabacteria bacterium]